MRRAWRARRIEMRGQLRCTALLVTFIALASAPAFAGTASLACVGDCDNNGTIAITDLMVGVRIDLGLDAVTTCPSFDRDGDGSVVVNELIMSINGAVNGAPSDAALCERAAADGLRACVERVNQAQRTCFMNSGASCLADDEEVAAAFDELEAAVTAPCRDAGVVRAAGFGPSFNPTSLVHR